MVNTPTDNAHTTYALAAQSLPLFAPAGVYNDTIEPIDVYLSRLPPSNVVAYRANGAITLTYADSGASNHCFVNRADFTEYEPYTTPRQG
ncbi:hypothetical protein C0991_000417, partial [Blastosporella zonata]